MEQKVEEITRKGIDAARTYYAERKARKTEAPANADDPPPDKEGDRPSGPRFDATKAAITEWLHRKE